jgi:amino acid adenylation domain-containing protein
MADDNLTADDRQNSPDIIAESLLSSGQRGLWLMQQLSDEGGVNNCVYGGRIPTDLNLEAFGRAVYRVAERHPILRTTFTSRHGEPVQLLHARPIGEHFKHYDARGWSSAELQARLSEEIHRRCDLERGPLVQFIIFTRSERNHLGLLWMHHIITDFWSIALYLADLGAFYTAELTGVPATLKPLTTQYSDFVAAQAEMLRSDEGARLWEFWREYLAGELPTLSLLTDRPRPPVQTFRGDSRSLSLAPELTARLEAVARTHGASTFAISLAAFQALLHRYTGQEEILVCSPKANRNRSMARVPGYFINPVPIRANLSGNPKFSDFLREVSQSSLAALAHGEFPYPLLVERLNLPRDYARPPLCQVAFAWQKTTRLLSQDISAFALNEEGGRLELGALTLESVHLDQRIAPVELTLQMGERDGQLGATIEYNTALYDSATITRMLGHFRTLLEGIVENPEARIADLPLFTEAERRQVLVEWNETAAPYSSSHCIHHLFAQRVAERPEAIAVRFNDQYLTYRKLDARSSQLARYLQKQGVGPDKIIGLCAERSLEMVIGILGVLKADAAYLPLDPHYPPDRLAFMFTDSQAGLLLTQSHLKSAIKHLKSEIQLICLDSDWPLIAEESADNFESGATPDNLAYVIYTSGSTGQPKGTLLEHRGLCNLAMAQQKAFGVCEGKCVLQFSPFSFDASVWEMTMALSSGATLVLARQESLISVAELHRLLRDNHVTHVTLPPAVLTLLQAEELPELEVVIAAGERCTAELAARWARGRRFFNAYGPTETTVCATLYECSPDASTDPPIGRPLPNFQLYVLDRNQQPVPVGVPGELCIGGAGLARGYLNQPELTAEKFIQWKSEVGSRQPAAGDSEFRIPNSEFRLYRTGDQVRWLADGNIEYLGRLDEQVKIRGLRVEPGEIEAVLRQHSAVRDACVVLKERAVGNSLLAAYMVLQNKGGSLSGASSWQELKEWLRAKLPEYMIPSAFVAMEALLLTPSGKIDRRALVAMPLPTLEREAGDFIAQTDAERTIAAVWQEILQVERVGRHDNFFDLGGHSLLAARIHERLKESFGQEFSIIELFRHPTVSALAEFLSHKQSAPHQTDLSLLNRIEKQKQTMEQMRRARQFIGAETRQGAIRPPAG